jgi:hypothetical protein
MAGPVVELQGGRRLRATLKKAAGDLEDLKTVHAQVAAMVSARAAGSSPHRSGRLASSIRGSRAAGSAVVRAGGARVPYAGVIHYGWPAHHIRAQPFLVDAAHDTEPAWTAVYLAGLDRILARVEGV